MKRLFLLLAVISVAFTSCREKPGPDDPYTDEQKARDGLFDLMSYIYFWRSNLPVVDKDDYAGPAELLEAMRYKDKDKWSFVADFDEFMASMQGEFVGHGISMALDTNDVVRVVMLYRNSDLWPQKVRRGWIVKQINDVDIAPIFISGDWAAYNSLMGPATVNRTNKFLFGKPDGTDVVLYSTKASFTVNSVLADTVFDISGHKIAYFCFESFIDPSEGELNTIFADFATQGAQDLIIDLRYNGGGYMDIAQQLASLCVNNTFTDDVCYKLKYNSYVSAEWDKSYNFIAAQNSLDLDRVVFITSRGTASASEVVINSLKPYMDVYLVGDSTHGKPCGMNLWGYPFDASDETEYDYVFAPITFEYTNSLNEGAFYDGMEPDEKATDDIMHDFGDTEEHSLKTALALLLGTKSGNNAGYHPVHVFSEGQQRPENLFLRDLRKE